MILLISLSLIACGSTEQAKLENKVLLETNNDISRDEESNTAYVNETGMIYIYGESHYVEDVIAKELEIWGDFYEEGMRHLFIESAYFEAQ